MKYILNKNIENEYNIREQLFIYTDLCNITNKKHKKHKRNFVRVMLGKDKYYHVDGIYVKNLNQVNKYIVNDIVVVMG